MSNSSSFKVGPDTSSFSLSLQSLYGIQNRKVLITGGGSGLGAFTAIAYALHGAHVYIVGRRKEKLEEVIEDFEKRKNDIESNKQEEGKGIDLQIAKKGKIIAIQGDISTKEGIQLIVNEYGKLENHLDILFNGAGIMVNTKVKHEKDDILTMAKVQFDQEWDNFTNSFNVNVTSIYFLTMAFVPFLDKAEKPSLNSPGASIIIIASVAGVHIASTHSVSYQTSKDATIKLNQIIAGRLQKLLIRSNVILPGIFPSEMTNAITPKDYENPNHPMHETLHKLNPIRRSGTFEDWAGLTILLASRAGAYYNGAAFTVDGGRLLNLSAA